MREGWTYKKLGEVCEIINGRAYKKEELLDSGKYRVLRVGNFFSNDSWYYSDLELDQKNYCDNGDLLYAWSASFGPRIWEGEKVVFHYHIWKLEHDECLKKRYLFYWLQSPYMTEQVSNEKHGATMSHLTKAIMENLILSIPPLSTQQQIVSELDLLSHILEQKRQQLKEYDTLAESIFYDMFGDPVENPKGFDIVILNDVCQFIKDGTHQTPRYVDKQEDGVKFLSAKDVVTGSINWDNIKYIPIELHEELYSRIAPQRNDVLLCKNGTYGIAALVETDEIFDVYVSLALLRPKQMISPKYLVSAINTEATMTQFKSSIKGIGVPNLHLGEIKKTKIVLPPLPLQHSFAAKIRAIEHQKQLLKESIKETEMLFQSRMDYWFNE